MHRWRNWSHTATCTPQAVATPTDEDELSVVVAQSREKEIPVKAVGSGHSFTDCATTSGTMIRLDHFDDIEWVGPPREDGSRLVRVGAGMTLKRLSHALDIRGLALENMGDVDKQTISGAVSTGTHGTGLGLSGFAGMVHHIRIVTSEGHVRNLDAHTTPGWFEAARLGLGAVGVITALTLRVVPAFTLWAHEAPRPLDEVLEALLDTDGPVLGHDHFEFYWFPHTTTALTKTNNRVPINDAPLPTWRRLLDDELLSNGVFNLTNRLLALAPGLTPGINRIASRALTERRYTAPSHRVFVTPRRVRFREMEYAIPFEAFPEAFNRLRAWFTTTGAHAPFPVEVRFSAGDDVWLSTAYQRPSAYIAVHQFAGMDYREYFQAVSQIMADFDGRPHWGKMHWLGPKQLRTRYPRFNDFLNQRDEMDPTRTFTNRYTARVLGP